MYSNSTFLRYSISVGSEKASGVLIPGSATSKNSQIQRILYEECDTFKKIYHSDTSEHPGTN